jgi:2-dehydro-3-deoxyphosphooctonate aldolase (KDO 8-P synthase)
MKEVKIANYKISNKLPLTLIAGPCQMESRNHALMMASEMKKITDKFGVNLVYKSSFDKANRSSVNAKRGIGFEAAIEIFREIKESFNLPTLTDIHNEEQAKLAGATDALDILQIPAFLCRQTDLLKAAANTGKIINIKKGQFLAPWDMQNVVAKMESFGNKHILLTERGASFGYNNLVSDMRSLAIMAEFGYPVIFDATHSVQQPGGLGGASGGQRHFVKTLARAAVAVGVAGIFAEIHEDPDNAPSDGPCMLRLDDLELFLSQITEIDKIIKKLQ